MKQDKITQLYFKDVNHPPRLDRRDFLKKLGSGLIVVFSLSEFAFLNNARGANKTDNKKEQPDFNAYLRIREDGFVECFTGKIEMGQGVITSLAQVLAEELEVPFESITMIMGDTELCPYDAGTWGSMTTRFFDPLLRAAAAEAKAELIKLGAEALKQPSTQLKAQEGYIVDTNNPNSKVRFADLTKGKKLVKTITKPPVLKKASQFKTIGQPMISSDATKKVTGAAKYTADIQLPGMLYAFIKRPPAHGANLKTVDTSRADAIKEIQILQEGDLIVALHENPLMAEEAMIKIKADWDIPAPVADHTSIFNYLKENTAPYDTSEEKGDIAKGEAAADFILESEYLDGYKAHASIETHAATATMEGDKLIVWASSQTPFGTRQAIADELKMPLEKVHLKQVFLGGGFGGKIYNDQAIEAAIISKLVGKPIQVSWTRQEEFMYDYFRPAAIASIKSGVNKAGKITSWKFDNYCAGSRGTKDFYNIPNLKTTSIDKRGIHPFNTGAWRAPGNNSTTFSRESHMDVMAHKVGMDPLAFRLKNIQDKAIINTLNLATKTFGYKSAKTGTNQGCGMAIGWDAGTIVVLIAEVKVDPATGLVTPLRMVCAQDMGQVVNPHGATLQTEGGLTMGLGYALYEDIEFEGGKVTTRNFDTYELTRFSVTPSIECVFVEAMEAAPQGGGEPAIITVGGAIANAVFHACGARVKQMPITPERILQALK